MKMTFTLEDSGYVFYLFRRGETPVGITPAVICKDFCETFFGFKTVLGDQVKFEITDKNPRRAGYKKTKTESNEENGQAYSVTHIQRNDLTSVFGYLPDFVWIRMAKITKPLNNQLND